MNLAIALSNSSYGISVSPTTNSDKSGLLLTSADCPFVNTAFSSLIVPSSIFNVTFTSPSKTSILVNVSPFESS